MVGKMPSPDGHDLVPLSLTVLVLSVNPHTKKPYPLKDRAVLKSLHSRRRNRHLAESKHLCMSYLIHRRRARHVHVWKLRLSFVTVAECVIWLKRPSESSSTASQYASAWETSQAVVKHAANRQSGSWINNVSCREMHHGQNLIAGAQTCILCKNRRKSWTI
ncbi:hypothetical protein ARMGADRAFT_429205 [Armillaria gallica]|uniref:Uncharacterized protein n=1 Tax=Armillaria gallica TaxID=47427 RepID=A0A2H3CZ73_ARMGA|nr:hypothetical protein ARMGADRAFT_429205 [Armillaria gallica]